jgi:hypothetical protein
LRVKSRGKGNFVESFIFKFVLICKASILALPLRIQAKKAIDAAISIAGVILPFEYLAPDQEMKKISN